MTETGFETVSWAQLSTSERRRQAHSLSCKKKANTWMVAKDQGAANVLGLGCQVSFRARRIPPAPQVGADKARPLVIAGAPGTCALERYKY